MTQMVPDSKEEDGLIELENKQYSCSTFMLYLGVNRENDLRTQIYASKDYVTNLEEIENKHQVSWDDPSVYVQNTMCHRPTNGSRRMFHRLCFGT